MRRYFLRQSSYVIASIYGFSFMPSLANANTYKEIQWDELMPLEWKKKVSHQLRIIHRYGNFMDNDPEAINVYSNLKKTWDNAPIVKTYIGQRIKIPGYVVPLDAERLQTNEFLIVPYFGACIHTPPPPANQIILVTPPRGLRFKTMDAVWVEGILAEGKTNSSMGTSAYILKADRVTAYK